MALATSASYHGPESNSYQTGFRAKLAGTDKYNDLIEKVAGETGCNPLLMKVLMAMESGGAMLGTNSLGYFGLMQTNYKRFIKELGAAYRTDPYLQIKSGAIELIEKKDYIMGVISRGNGKGPKEKWTEEIFQTAWAYNGYTINASSKMMDGYRYAQTFQAVYEGMGGSMQDKVKSGQTGGGTGTSGGTGGGETAKEKYDGGAPDWKGGGERGIGGEGPGTSTKLEDYEKNDPNSSMFIGMSPNVEEDVYPAHRYAGNPFVLRIGDCQFFIPPTSITTDKQASVDAKHQIRAKSPTVTKSGYTNNTISIQLYFCGEEQINGYPVEAPGGKVYFMDGLRSLLAQFYKNPFLPIRNELINNQLDIFNVALQDITYTVDQNLPNVLIANLTLVECAIEPFVNYPEFVYDRLFVYPLFRWWYQQQLMGTEADRYSATWLKPVNKKMNSKAFFKVLDRDLIEQMKHDVTEKNKNVTNSDGTRIHPEYALARMKVGDIRKLMTDWEIGDAVLTNVTVSVGKRLTPIHMDDYEKPAFQDLGGYERTFVMEYYCTNRDQLASLQAMVSHLEEMSRDYRFRFVSGFLAIDNELVNLAGIQNAMVMGIQSETVPGYNDNYVVRLFCREFNTNQKNQERLNGINFTMNDSMEKYSFVDEVPSKTSRKNEIAYEEKVDRILNDMELYPDLELPTYEVANKAVASINEFRQSKQQSKLPYDKLKQPPGATWCDPDFYFAYPTSKQLYSHMEFGDVGDKLVNQVLNGSYDEIQNMAGDEGFWQTAKDTTELFTKGVYDNSWDADPDGKRKLLKSSSVTFENASKTFLVPAGESWGDEKKIPDDKDLVEMMTHDMVVYNNRGRMNRAFPTYMLLFVDEGQWVDGKRLWNNYYTYHAIHQIDVTKDKDNAVDLAFVSLANVYGTFDFQAKMSDPRKYAKEPIGILGRLSTLRENFSFTVTEKVLQERSQLMEQVKLKEGARVHLRMGYSSHAANLPIVFNGKIASVNEGEEIQMLCQGDGAELINQFYTTDPKGDTPNEPHNTFQEMLTKRTSNYWFTVSEDFEFGENYLSYYGIEHFGFVESQAGGFWTGIGKNFEILKSFLTDSVPFSAYDIMKNIYKGSNSPVTGQETGWSPFDGEKNINISAYNKTPWDIGQILSMFVPEFICSPHVHGFRSTLFFGMPHWPVKYGYRLKEGKKGTEYKDYDEMIKPFQQFHMITSGNDILRNNIMASSEKIKHIAAGVYKMGNGQDAAESYTVWADRTILKEHQKMMMVDTGVWQDLLGPDFLYTALGKYGAKPIMEAPGSLLSLLGDGLEALPLGDTVDGWGQKLQEWATDYTEWLDADSIFTPGQVQARTVAIGSLQRKFMEMYQGELVIFGDPAIKPWDIFYLDDTHMLMSGTAQVGKVTHSLGLDSGFMTVIKPDLITSRTDGKGMRTGVINGLALMGSALAVTVSRKIIMSRLGTGAAKLGAKAAIKTGAGAGKVVSKFTPKAIKQSRVAKWGAGKIKTGVNIAKEGQYLTKGLNLLKGNFVTLLLFGAVSEWAGTWFEKNTKYNNMIYIYPLWKMGEPFAAGITGGAHIIPGYVDRKFADPGMTGKITPPKQNFIDENGREKKKKGGSGGSGGGGSSASRNAIVEGGKSYEGKLKYVFGGTNIEGGTGDCSGFTSHVFQKFGNINIGRTTGEQVQKGTAVTKGSEQPGDLIFFKNTYKSTHIYGVSHVGIVIGGGKMVHLGDKGCQIADYNTSYWQQHFLMFRSYITDTANVGSIEVISGGSFRHPLERRTSITSGWGNRKGGFHYGTDLAPLGYTGNHKAMETKVYAVADGKIIDMGLSDTMGNYVILATANKAGKPHVITYMHFRQHAPGISKGMQVKAGTFIGYMGTTGDSTGVHLHIEVNPGTSRDRGNRVNPVPWFQQQGVQL